jgi:hypothetical protein
MEDYLAIKKIMEYKELWARFISKVHMEHILT